MLFSSYLLKTQLARDVSETESVTHCINLKAAQGLKGHRNRMQRLLQICELQVNVPRRTSRLCLENLRLKTKELKENDSSAASFIFL
jgi:hypothetical protein